MRWSTVEGWTGGHGRLFLWKLEKHQGGIVRRMNTDACIKVAGIVGQVGYGTEWSRHDRT